jgi:hypothetical protein
MPPSYPCRNPSRFHARQFGSMFGILVQMGRRTPLRTGCQARAPPFFRTREQSKKEAAFGYACALTMCACLYSADSTISKIFRRTCLECPSDTYQDETGHRKSDCKVQFETCSVGESISAQTRKPQDALARHAPQTLTRMKQATPTRNAKRAPERFGGAPASLATLGSLAPSIRSCAATKQPTAPASKWSTEHHQTIACALMISRVGLSNGVAGVGLSNRVCWALSYFWLVFD